MTVGTRDSCTCSVCVGKCKSKPGWFLPGEAEAVAAFLQLSLQELFDRYLGVDWWVGGFDEDIFLLAPAIQQMEAGDMYPARPTGRCVFLEKARCRIHPVKPQECREAFHDQTTSDIHKQTAMAWIGHRQQIEDLLGCSPCAAVSYPFMW